MKPLPALLYRNDSALPVRDITRLRLRVQRIGRAASYWKTFWHALEDRPDNIVATAVPALLDHLPSKAGISGVEWWIGRMRTTHVPLDFHHDRDVRLFEETGRIRHPRWSSVLFLSSVRGGSLLVTDQRLRRRGSELVLVPSEARRFATVRPELNRFVVFPGDLCHGVLDAFDRVPERPLPPLPRTLRLTIVINWWTERPRGIRSWAESRAYRSLALRPGH
jgi:hypothetical protein